MWEYEWLSSESVVCGLCDSQNLNFASSCFNPQTSVKSPSYCGNVFMLPRCLLRHLLSLEIFFFTLRARGGRRGEGSESSRERERERE